MVGSWTGTTRRRPRVCWPAYPRQPRGRGFSIAEFPRDGRAGRRARLKLADALGVTGDEVVALVGGGGKTTAMFRLAREMVEKGTSTITTTTTRIFAAQIALAPAHVQAA